MKTIMLRYAGNCRTCGSGLAGGVEAVYERRVGIFCLGCQPTDPESIRAVRQEAADRKADKYQEWATKRQAKALATISRNRTFTGDIAFNTQPGHIPLRAKIIAQNDRAYDSLLVAKEFERKAESLRHVMVAGDTERKREAQRQATLAWVKIGMEVKTALYGVGTVKRINRKTATISNTGQSGTFQVACDLSWLRPV